MNPNIYKIIFIAFFICCLNLVSAQVDTSRLQNLSREEIMNLTLTDLLDLPLDKLLILANKIGVSIDELLQMKTSVASKTELTPRESPGIVSIITEEEIRTSGARDMIDVLRMVPGFDFGYDVSGVISIGLRGNWVHEGKVLLLVDGQEMNELSYYNLIFGNHYNVDDIKRIEIIRGPGSSVYGGNSELGVIHIITKDGNDLKGIRLSGMTGASVKNYAYKNASLQAGAVFKGWNVSLKGFYGDGNHSDGMYYGFYGDTVDLSGDNKGVITKNLNLGISKGGFSGRIILDDYKTKYYYEGDTIYNRFRTYLGELKYTYKINDRLTLIPKINVRHNYPYYEENYWRNFYFTRYSGQVLANYNPIPSLNIAGGIEYYYDNGTCVEDTGIFYYNNQPEIQFNNVSGFIQGVYKFKFFNIIGGGRVEKHSEYGYAFAPRIGITSVFSRLHTKILFSWAYRAPSIGNIDVGPGLMPEKSLIAELETGYKLNDNMFITANFYNIIIDSTIIYYDYGGSVPGVDWGYMNSNRTGSLGFEIEYKIRYQKFAVNAGYSYYTVGFHPKEELYEVPGVKNQVMALAPHKFTISGNYKITKTLTLNSSLCLLSSRYGYTSLDTADNPVIEKFNPALIWNIFIEKNNLFVKGLSLSGGIYDILDARPPYIQPYNGYIPPYPGRPRQIGIKLSYKLGYK